ncbi:MAG TPA: aminotransferase class V-fold PLP-dependent enzyme [Gemmatimonadaceae bacterium]|nr:aminotransferase class V-fold PLP-dependent enzyme [Gemmatimonadaceae bacterium]
MTFTRRDMIVSLSGLMTGAALGKLHAERPLQMPTPRPPSGQGQGGSFPRKADFHIAEGYTYINGAYTHPVPIVASDAYRYAVDRRGTIGAPPALAGQAAAAPQRIDAKAAFASLINAKPSEISYVPNTSTGENLVAECLGIAKNEGNVVTDALHFEGALIHLTELQKRGLDLRIVMPRDGRIDLRDLERVVDNKTKLIELSFVSMYNGFQHDLKAVCDLAHAHGAYVYADIIQGVGAVPLDVRATNLDFAACATYKWLMGDFGLAFFYVREDLLGSVVRRPHWSYESAPDTEIHLSPFDPQAPKPVTYTPGTDATSYFQLGTYAMAVGAALGTSIPYIQALGVQNIQNWRIPLLRRLQQELPRLGFTAQTPLDSTSPIVTFAHKDEGRITQKLQAARVNVRIAPYWMRISPSVYNDMQDVDRLLNALS